MPNKFWLPFALLFIIIYSFVGFDWGILSASRLEALKLDEKAGLVDDIVRLTEEKGYAVNLHVTGHEEGPEELVHLHSIVHLSWDKNKSEILRIIRHYLIWSYSGDVATAFGPLSTMNPRRLNFNPHSFQYGGAFLYPLAAVLKFSSWIGVTHVASDAGYYIRHPLEFRKLVLAGRTLCVMMNLATLVLIYKTTRLWKDERTALLAVALYVFIPGPLCLSRELKPHAYAVAWVMMACYYALRYLRENREWYWILSAVGAGLATGSCLNYGVSFLIPLVAVLGGDLAKRMRHVCYSLLLFGFVLVITNPYALISHELFFQEMTALKQAFSFAGEVLTPWTNIFVRGAPWWLSLAAGTSLIFYIFGDDPFSEKLLMAAFPVMYTLCFYAASSGECPPRFAIIIYPWFAMLCAWGLSRIIQKRGWAGILLATALVGLTCMKGSAYVVNFALDARGESDVFRAGRFLSKLPAGSHVGCLAFPAPESFPALPFYQYPLTTFPDIDTLQKAPEKELPDYLVITDDAITDIPRYRLDAEFLPFSFGTRTLFQPEILSSGTPAWRFRIFHKIQSERRPIA